MSILLFANQAQTTLALPITSTQTTITVASGTGSYFPAPSTNQSITLTIVSALSGLITEIISCTNITGDVLTVARGQEGTVARAWNQSDFVINMMTAGTGNAFAQLYALDNGYYSPVFNNMFTTTGQVANAPVNGNDLVNKSYVDSVTQGLFKAECQVATTANITLLGLQVIDGYTTIAGDRVLVKNQFNNAYNGIYIAFTTAWVRAGDMEVWSQVPGAATFVQNGTLYANTGWNVIAPENGTINVTPIIWTQFSGYGTYTAGTGLSLTGTQFSITSTGVVSGSYGTATFVPTLSINPQGQITSVSNTPISIAPSQINATIPNSGLTNSSITIGSTNVSLGNTLTTLSGVSISGSTNTFTNIPNSGLSNSSITINENLVALGGTTTITAITPNTLTIGTGLSGTSFNGSSPVTIAISNTGVTAGSYGSAGSVGTFTVNAQGQITNASTTSIAISNTQVSGLGTISTQNANNVAITGGTIQGVSLTIDSLDNTPIGSTTASTAKFTTLSANSTVTLGNYTGYVYANGAGTITSSTTIPTTALSGTITNAQLANSSITINGTATSLGGSINVGTVTSVTGTSPISSSGGITPIISISQASSTTNGYLSSTDWNTFNSKGSGSVTSITAGTGLSGGTITTTGTIAIANTAVTAGSYTNASITVNAQGQLTSASSGTAPITSVTGTSPINSSGGTTPAISISQANLTTNGYLSSADWNTFNNKQPAGIYVNSVSGTTGRITSTGGVTSIIDLASGIVTAGTTGSSTLIPVVTVDTYGRVTNITTASNPQGTVTSVSGTGTVNGITLTGTVTSSGSLTLGGTLGSIANSQLTNSSITINGNAVSLGGSTTVTANTANSLTFNTSGTGGTSPIVFNGSTAYTISYNTIGASPLAGSSSLITTGTITTGTWNGTAITPSYGGTGATTLTGYVYGNGTGTMTASITIPTTALSGTISNAQLANSSLTVGGTSISLGGSGSFPLENLTDVSVSGASVGQLLGWNGSSWVNVTNTQSGSAGQGISFWNATPIIIPSGTNNSTPIATLSTSPVTAGGTKTSVSNPNNNTVTVIGLLSAPLGRTLLDAGQWTFDIYAGVDTVTGGRISTLTRNTYQVIYSNASSITFTTTGTGTSRTLTSSSAFFANAVASATNTIADFVSTPQGLYQITAKASNTSITILVPSTYVNESAVSGQLWHNLFGITSPPITNITPAYGLYVVQTTQPAFTINATDSLGSIGFTTSNNNTVFTVAYNGTQYATNVLTPLVTLHNGLGGLQGGSANQYYHLTSTEYTGTGSGTFVKQNNPSLIAPNLNIPSAITLTNATGLPLTTGVTGVLGFSNGGTNANLTASAGSVAYSTTSAIAFTGVGTAGQVLISNGTSAPTFGAVAGGSF